MDHLWTPWRYAYVTDGRKSAREGVLEERWADPAQTTLLSENNRRFGAEHCSEARSRNDLASVLAEWHIGLSPDAFSA